MINDEWRFEKSGISLSKGERTEPIFFGKIMKTPILNNFLIIISSIEMTYVGKK